MFFVIETKRPVYRDELDSWDFFERHAQLFTARTRVSLMLERRPDLVGKVRIIRCQVLSDLAHVS